jgi:hypothetical protein
MVKLTSSSFSDPESDLKFLEMCQELDTASMDTFTASIAHVAAAISYLVPTAFLMSGKSIFPRYEKPCQPWRFPADRYHLTTNIEMNCQWAYCHLALARDRYEPQIIREKVIRMQEFPGGTPESYMHYALHAICPNMVVHNAFAPICDDLILNNEALFQPPTVPDDLTSDAAWKQYMKFIEPVNLAQHLLLKAIMLQASSASNT